LTKYIRKPKYSESYALKAAAAKAAGSEAASGAQLPVKFNFIGIVFAVLGIGLIIRIVLMFTVTGFRSEVNETFKILNGGNQGYSDGSIGVYPIPSYIYSFLGLISRALGVNAESFTAPLFVKLPLILADAGLILLLYFAAKKYVNEYVGLILAGFAAVFPPFIIASSVWGSIFSLLALFLALTFYFIAAKKMTGLFISYTLALLTAKDALYLLPVVAVFVLYQTVKAVKHIRSGSIKGFKAIYKDPDARSAITVPLFIIISFLMSWLISLPLSGAYRANPFAWFSMLCFKPLGSFYSFGFNAMTVYSMIGKNGDALGETFPTVLFGVIFMIIITALVLLVYLSRKNRANLVYLAGFIMLTMSIFFLDFTAMNLVSALALFLLAIIFVRDKRIISVVGLMGLAFTLNACFSFMSAGYLNTLGADEFTSALYTGNELLEGGYMAASVACSVIMILTWVYSTIIILDIAMSNKRKLFAELDGPVGFGASLKKFFKRS
jgi:Gpi18-like mannosyltransferase